MTPDELAGPHVHGEIVVSRFEYLRRTYGPESVGRILDALPEEERLAFKGFDREGWYPFRAVILLDRAITKLYAHGDQGTLERLGELSAEARTEWLGEHASLVNVHGFLSRTAETHRRFHNFGQAHYRRIAFCEGELAMSEYPTASDVYCRSALGYLRGSLERLTGHPAVVEERTCQARGDASCTFYMRWTTAPGEA